MTVRLKCVSDGLYCVVEGGMLRDELAGIVRVKVGQYVVYDGCGMLLGSADSKQEGIEMQDQWANNV